MRLEVLAHALNQRGRITIVERRSRDLDTLLRIACGALDLEDQRGTHEQGIAVRAFVFACENPLQFVGIVIRVAAREILGRTFLKP